MAANTDKKKRKEEAHELGLWKVCDMGEGCSRSIRQRHSHACTDVVVALLQKKKNNLQYFNASSFLSFYFFCFRVMYMSLEACDQEKKT